MYKWVDEDGITQYSDTPPASQPTLEIHGNISSYTTPSLEKVPDGFFDESKPGRTKRVVMYSAAWCGVCKQARSYFQRKSIHFTEYDIDKSERARKEFDKLKGTGVPVILIGKNRLNGFSAQRFDEIYYN
jgi:glutaredoxin